MKVINDTANQLASEMRSIPVLENPLSTAELDRPELRITPKPQLAADLGVSTEALSETSGWRRSAMSTPTSQVRRRRPADPDPRRARPRARADIGLLQALRVSTGAGASVPLSTVANFDMSRGPTRSIAMTARDA